MKLNLNYSKLEENYLFTEIAQRTSTFIAANPDKHVIKLGIGDVTRPLAPIAADAIINAMEELKHGESFRGYGPELGYQWARQAVVDYYKTYNVDIHIDEITIGDGIGEDIANITDIFAKGENTVLLPDPVYPLYKATSLMDNQPIVYLECSERNNFTPAPPVGTHADLIYLCSPNNPTGATFTFAQLTEWVDYANSCGAIILYDNAYERFISSPDCPHSIYAIPGAKTCAIEFNSLSKTAGFTCVRSGWTIVPQELTRDGISLLRLWQQRQTTKYNGAPYMTQRGLVAALSPQGIAQADANIAEYKKNVPIICDVLRRKGITFSGGDNSPYIWLKCPNNMKSWEFFDHILNNAYVVGTPGVGFGQYGEGYYRLSTFNTVELTTEAMNRIDKLL